MSPAIEPIAQWARSFGHAGYLVWLLVWAMPVLLGMSFLNRTEMRREGQTMTLTKRF